MKETQRQIWFNVVVEIICRHSSKDQILSFDKSVYNDFLIAGRQHVVSDAVGSNWIRYSGPKDQKY